jgi:hypothetical protein
MTIHDLKCWPEPFQGVVDARKLFEFRRDDRGFKVADLLLLREWEPARGDYTERMLMVRVTWIERGPAWDIPEGHVVMSILPVRLEVTNR